jgi:hypothetical protein
VSDRAQEKLEPIPSHRCLSRGDQHQRDVSCRFSFGLRPSLA